jgi:Tfp pilus assembly protein PilF
LKPSHKTKDKQTSKKAESRLSLVYGFLLIVLCFSTYANSLGGEFVWDDQDQVLRNTQIRTIENIPLAFTTSLWSFRYSHDPGVNNHVSDRYYRPVQTVIYIAIYQLAGLSPLAYHLTNVALHSAATLLVYLLCLELGLDATVGLMASALFAVHPVHTEAVTWIAGVGDLACAVFYFAGLLGFLRYLRSQKLKWLVLSSICFLGALFSKEMAATFPLVLLLLLTVRKEQWKSLKNIRLMGSIYILVVLVYAVFRITAVGLEVPAAAEVTTSMLDWATLVIWVVGSYLRYAIIPYPLYTHHLAPLHFGDRIFSTLAYAAAISAIGTALAVWWRRLSTQCIWVLVFFVSLFPVLYFKGISGGAFFAERYLYIPSMAIVLAFGFLLTGLKRSHAILLTCAVTTIFSVVTIYRNRDWHDEEKLFERTLQFQPEAANIWTSLGEVYLRQGDNARAQKYLESALKHVDDPRFVRSSYEEYRAYHGLGLAAARQSRPVEAVTFLQKALKIYPQGDAAYTTLGGVFVNQGWDYAGALTLLDKAVKLNPVNDLARDYMGVALMNHGEVDRAIQYFHEALQINPDLESAKQHLDLALRVNEKVRNPQRD